jgi:hypothetical protein
VRAGIMQPYLFPYPGHFALICSCDTWVVFDISQFTPKSWMTRNRLAKPDGGWAWFTAEVHRMPREARACDAILVDPATTLRRLRGQLGHFRRKAPHWADVDDLVISTFSGLGPGSRLVDLDVASLTNTCHYLGIGFHPLIASAEEWDLSEVHGPGDWAPVISAAIKADEYLNPVSGLHLFDDRSFVRRGTRLSFFVPPRLNYLAGAQPAQEGLSILDAMLWLDSGDIRTSLNCGRIVPGTQALSLAAT